VYRSDPPKGKKVADQEMLHASLSSVRRAQGEVLAEGYIANRIDHPRALSILDDDTAEDGSAVLGDGALGGRIAPKSPRAKPATSWPPTT